MVQPTAAAPRALGESSSSSSNHKTPGSDTLDGKTEIGTAKGRERRQNRRGQERPAGVVHRQAEAGTRGRQRVDRLVNAPRILPTSCLDKRDTRLITFHPCNPSTFHCHGTEEGNRTPWTGEHFPAGQSPSWLYDMSAWATVQPKGHSGTGGVCVGLEQTEKWADVVAFYDKHKLAIYCSITAEREVWTQQNRIVLDKQTNELSHIDTAGAVASAGGSALSQYATLYLRCVGCGCVDGIFEDWVARGEPSPGCTDHTGKPGVATPDEAKAVAARVARKALEQAFRSLDYRIRARRRNKKPSDKKLAALVELRATYAAQLGAERTNAAAARADEAREEELAVAGASASLRAPPSKGTA